MTRENDQDPADQGEYDQEGEMAKDSIKTVVRHAQALEKILGDNDNLPEWVQAKLAKIESMMTAVDDYMQNQEGGNEEMAEMDKSQTPPGRDGGDPDASKKEYTAKTTTAKKVAKDGEELLNKAMSKKKDKGLPEKAAKKNKEEEVEESSTTAGSVATSTASKGGSGMVGKGIYDSMNRELEKMIAESMNINMSDSTEGDKSLTVTATDDDAMKLGMMLKNAGLGGGDAHGGDMHSHEQEPCDTCGMTDCGCGDVHEAVDENSPDYPTNTEQADNNFGYAGGLNKPKSSGMATVPVTDVQLDGEDKFGAPAHEDALRRMMEMAGIKQAELDPSKETMKETVDDVCNDCHKDPCECEESVEESIRRMKEIAGIREAKKQIDQNGDGKNDFEDIKIARMKASGAIDDKEEKKVEESIFALTNQWQAYKG
jgi:hypothetical protein